MILAHLHMDRNTIAALLRRLFLRHKTRAILTVSTLLILSAPRYQQLYRDLLVLALTFRRVASWRAHQMLTRLSHSRWVQTLQRRPMLRAGLSRWGLLVLRQLRVQDMKPHLCQRR